MILHDTNHLIAPRPTYTRIDDPRFTFSIQPEGVINQTCKQKSPLKSGSWGYLQKRGWAIPEAWQSTIDFHMKVIHEYRLSLGMKIQSHGIYFSFNGYLDSNRMVFLVDFPDERDMTTIEQCAMDGLIYKMEEDLLRTCACCSAKNAFRRKLKFAKHEFDSQFPFCGVCANTIDPELITVTGLHIPKQFRFSATNTKEGETGTWLDSLI